MVVLLYKLQVKIILSEGKGQSKLLVESNEILFKISWKVRNKNQTLKNCNKLLFYSKIVKFNS